MKSTFTYLKIALILGFFMFLAIPNANAWAKAGEATVTEGGTVTIPLGDAYQYTLQKATGISYRWFSEDNSYAQVTSSTKDYATVKGIKATSSCRIYYECSYYINNFYRTMEFYFEVTVKGANISVTSVELSQYSAELKEGDILYLNAYVYPTNATNRNVNWSTSNIAVASVDYNGIVRAVSAGKTTITCKAADGSGKYATCSVNVTANTVYVSGISLNESSANLNEGETLQLKATISPSNATDQTVSWSSDNTEVATVSNTGLVKAISGGKAIITCKANDGSGKYASCTINVPVEILPQSIALSEDNLVMKLGDSMKLESIIEPSNVSNKSVSWTSDNNSVATVDNNGVITACGIGTANIKATTVNNLAASCHVTVNEREPAVKFNWEGHYNVVSSHVGNNLSRDYPDNFGMDIEKIGDKWLLTSFMGEDLKKYNNGGLLVTDNGDGTASVDLSDDIILQYTSNDKPLYVIYVWDEQKDDWATEWIFIANEDGTLSLGEFYIASFKWSEMDSVWKDAILEVGYYDLTATKGTPQLSEEYYKNVHIGNLYYDLDPVMLTASVICKIDPLTSRKEFGYISGDVIVPETVNFDGMDYLVTSIDEEAFYGCYDLSSLILPNSLKFIGESALAYTGITEISLPGQVEKVCNFAFEGSEIEYIILKGKVNFIGNGIIAFCENLRAIYVDSDNKYFRSFENCLYDSELKKLYAAPAQSELIFPDELETIGAYAITKNFDIEKIVFPPKLQMIEEYAFYYCGNLSEVVCPESLSEIQDGAFIGCYSLKEISFGSNLAKIGDSAFTSNCLSLIKINAVNPPEIAQNTFGNYNATLLVPSGSKSVYQNHDIWGKFYNITDDENEIGGIEDILDIEEFQKFDIFSINGNIVKKDATKEDLQSLKSGLYIIGNKKVMVQ